MNQGIGHIFLQLFMIMLSESFIHSIRPQAHLVGPRPWDPYSKAKYLFTLKEEYRYPMEKLISECGGRATEVQNYIEGYRDMEKYYRPLCKNTAEFNKRHFSAFVELQKPAIKNALTEIGWDIEKFSQLVKDDKFSPFKDCSISA